VSPFNLFQTAYVVADIDAGVAIAARRFGIPAMQVTRGSRIETGNGIAVGHFALAFVGETQIEIIQPAGGADHVYRQMVAGDGLTLHHLGVLLDRDADWDAVIEENRRDGVDMPVSGDFAGLMRYAYFDRRAELGHFVEYMQASAAGATIFDDVPRYRGPIS
jgi:extradiol dioxygenase family protein